MVEALANSSRSDQTVAHRRLAYGGPVDAIWGERDGIIPPSHLPRVAASLPQTETYMCGGIGHYLHRDCPDVLIRVVERAVATALLRVHDAGTFRTRVTREDRLRAPRRVGTAVQNARAPRTGRGARLAAGLTTGRIAVTTS